MSAKEIAVYSFGHLAKYLMEHYKLQPMDLYSIVLRARP